MVDIVERLREIQEYKDGSDIEVDVSVWKPCYAGEAADEIECLLERISRQAMTIESYMLDECRLRTELAAAQSEGAKLILDLQSALTELREAQKDASFWRGEVARLAKDKNVEF